LVDNTFENGKGLDGLSAVALGRAMMPLGIDGGTKCRRC
jgi:hypothetical protein